VKPYYEHGGITIYHGDCRDVLPDVWFGVDLLLTDPPYGINAVQRGRTFGTSNACATNEYIPVHDDDKPFDPAHLLAFRRAILWGANHYADKLPSESCWLTWDKRDGTKSNPLADCELAWTNLGGPARLFSHRWMGMIRESERDKRMHPTQKPVALMRWCIAQAALAVNSVIVDAYMGCGPVLVAAKEFGHFAIGIEIEERYCEIAAKRLAQEVLPLEAVG
jgi:site-specific DNA-methyltransferase (adenine-specific)